MGLHFKTFSTKFKLFVTMHVQMQQIKKMYLNICIILKLFFNHTYSNSTNLKNLLNTCLIFKLPEI